MKTGADNAARALDWIVLAFALTASVTISLAEPLAYAMLPLWLILVWKRVVPRGPPSPYALPVAIFVAAVVLASVMGLRPLHSIRKLDRLLLLGVVFVLPAVFAPTRADGWKYIRMAAALFVAGATTKALFDLVRIPYELWTADAAAASAASGLDPVATPLYARMPLLYKLGNMREPQMYTIAMCFLVGALVKGTWKERRGLLWFAFTVIFLAFVLHFKRGAWFAFVLTALLLAVVAGNRKLFATVGLCAALLVAFPQVRGRITMLQEELSFKLGGRMLLWTRTAPRLITAHPMGLGWRAVRNEDLTAVSRHVQHGLNHLHNNVLQVTLELGWLGLAAWLNWMGVALYIMWKNVRRARDDDPEAAALALGTLGAFCALQFNGVVEYNFGDGEMFMVMSLLMGLSAAVWQRQRAAAEGLSA